ncbi:MAG: YraN family protein [Hydrogenothermus sp.]|nr:MAG: YraN family protein [Hydrogenothermus sp.]
MNKRKIGIQKENLAVNYLKNKGYKIIKQNFYTKYGEIDIIAKNKDTLVFVEVRSKSYNKFGNPEETIDKTKQRKIINTAKVFLKNYNLDFEEIRFDVIAILEENINHIENAFYLE